MSRVPPDDPTIRDEETLWRRILYREDQPDWYEQRDGEWRPTSVAFLDNRSPSHSLSAYISSETELNLLLTDYPRNNIAGFLARTPREFDQTIQRVPDAGYDSHVEITPPPDQWGKEQRKRNLRKTAAREMAHSSHWVYIKG